MPCRVVVGCQWGDEGKAKVIDYLAEDSRYIVRYQGGANAGHTLVKDKQQFIFHLLPSAFFQKNKVGVIGNGVVLDPESLLQELKAVQNIGIDVTNRLMISNHCQLIFPYHKVLDVCQEKSLGRNKIGTTGKGVGPGYSDKMSRIGFRLENLYSSDFSQRLRFVVEEKNFLIEKYYREKPLQWQEIYANYMVYAERLEPYIVNVPYMLNEALRKGENVLFEGAQGTLLDVDLGLYPYVTSSNTVSGSVCSGAGVPPSKIDEVIGVFKAYSTRVGEGEFPAELCNWEGEFLQREGKEFGATTGRTRRCGWLDMVLCRYSIMINGLHKIFLTKLDVLDHLETIGVCVAYEVNGEWLETFNVNMQDVKTAKPVFKMFPGWNSSTKGIKEYKDLPKNACRFLDVLEEYFQVPISFVSIGPEREDTLMR